MLAFGCWCNSAAPARRRPTDFGARNGGRSATSPKRDRGDGPGGLFAAHHGGQRGAADPGEFRRVSFGRGSGAGPQLAPVPAQDDRVDHRGRPGPAGRAALRQHRVRAVRECLPAGRCSAGRVGRLRPGAGAERAGAPHVPAGARLRTAQRRGRPHRHHRALAVRPGDGGGGLREGGRREPVLPRRGVDAGHLARSGSAGAHRRCSRSAITEASVPPRAACLLFFVPLLSLLVGRVPANRTASRTRFQRDWRDEVAHQRAWGSSHVRCRSPPVLLHVLADRSQELACVFAPGSGFVGRPRSLEAVGALRRTGVGSLPR